jgi:hypothetical protein
VSQQYVQQLRALARSLETQFLGKQETVRLMILSVLAVTQFKYIEKRVHYQ